MAEVLRDGAPVVSVIVPAHDAAGCLGDALESLRVQTLADIEILVIDDGSSDASESIAQSYAARDPRFRVLRRDTASGRPACARNIGLRAARGDYVALLDADDVAVPTRLEVSLRALRATGASLVFGDFRKFEDGGATFDHPHLEGLRFVERAAGYLDPVGDGIYRCSPRFAAYLLTDIPAVNTQTFFAVRADLAATGLFDESLVGGEDFDLFLRLVERYPAAYVDTVQTLMRMHAASLTATQNDRCVQDAIHVRRAHLEALRGKMTDAERHGATDMVAGMLADLGYARWVRGAGSSARAALAECWQVRPARQVALMYLKAWLPRPLLTRAVGVLRGSPT